MNSNTHDNNCNYDENVSWIAWVMLKIDDWMTLFMRISPAHPADTQVPILLILFNYSPSMDE